MASKIPPPASNVTKDSGRAAALNKALEDKGTTSKKKSAIDPLRDPSTYTQDELNEMMSEGEVPATFSEPPIERDALDGATERTIEEVKRACFSFFGLRP